MSVSFFRVIMNLKILSWNVRGIMSSTVCLLKLLTITECDIAVISEHKLKPNFLPYMNSIDMSFNSVSRTDKLDSEFNCTHGKGGISIMYKKKLQFSVDEFLDTNSDRIVGIELKSLTCGSVFIFGVYLPADGSIDKYRHEIHVLDDLYSYYSSYGRVILAGDFNACCINKNREFTNTLKSNELTQFVSRHSLCHPFTAAYQISMKGPDFTFVLKQTMLDYIFANNILVRQLRSYEILEEGSFSSTSDHLPIVAEFDLQGVYQSPLSNSTKLPAWHKITDDDIRNYQSSINETIEHLLNADRSNTIDIETLYSELISILLDAANTNIPTAKYNPFTKPYWNNDVKIAHKREREFRRIWVQEGRPRGMQHTSYSEYKKAKRAFKNVQTLAYEQYISTTYEDLNKHAECDLRLFWKSIKRHRPNRSKFCTEIQYNGNVHRTPETVCDAFAEYFQELYKSGDANDNDIDTSESVNNSYNDYKLSCENFEYAHLPDGPIDEEEIVTVIKQLKRRKACGSDMIQNEHIIYGGPKVVQCLKIMFSLIIEKMKIPNEWRNGLIVPIFKGGTKIKSSPDSYRPVCLLSSILKLFEKLILNRIQTFSEVSENFPSALQQGFQKNLSCLFFFT